MPLELWLNDVSRVDAASAFGVADPLARYEVVNRPHTLREASSGPVPLSLAASHTAPPHMRRAAVVDLHYLSVRSVEAVLRQVLPGSLAQHAEVWLLAGTGHHTAKGSHQRSEAGGVLRAAVEELLRDAGYAYYIGKDAGGHSGALLVVPT